MRGRFPVVPGWTGWPKRWRATLTTMSGSRRACLCRGMRGSVLFGDFLSPLADIQAVVGRMSAIPVTGYLLQILDPAEADLPYSGRIRFRGLEREGDTLIPRVEGVRDEYGRRLKAQQEGLAAICSAAGFGFAIHRTDHSPEAALLGLYTALTAR